MILMLHTNSSMNDSSSFDSMPSLLYANVAYDSKYERGNPHCNVWQRGESTSGLNVELKNVM